MGKTTVARLLVIACLAVGIIFARLPAPSVAAATWEGPDAAPARPGAIGDFVWYDADGDGIEDVSEPGIANVQLALYRDDDGSGTLTAGDTLVATTLTGMNGGYLFDVPEDGAYLVKVLSAGVAGGPLDGLTQSVRNQAQPDPTAPINVSGGYVYRDADFGYRRLPGSGQAIIGHLVWYDANGDGAPGDGEGGMAGVSVCATPSGGGAATCAVTDAAGRYRLAVAAGSYIVAPAAGVPAGLTATTTVPRVVVAAAAQQMLQADFGYRDATGSQLGAIGNLVFVDANANGVFDAGDSPLAGISIDLIRDANANGVWDGDEPIMATAISGSVLDAQGGNYRFADVPAGAYLIHVSATNALLLDYEKSPLGTPDANGHNQRDPYPVVLAAGASVLTADFGYHLAGFPDSRMIGNLVWVERDGDGGFTAADVGQPGVTIELSQGEETVATTTGASGQYSFIRLPAGVYSLRVSDDFGVLAGLSATATGAAPGQDNNNQAQPYAVALTADQYNYTADFGYYQVNRLAAIGDFVWYDADGDGIEDLGERGLPNVRVAAYLDTNGNGVLDAADTLYASTVTDAAGGYLLAGLPAGAYFIDIVDATNPNGALAGLTHSVGMQSQPDPTTPINLAPGQIYKDADFGYVKEPAAGKALIGDLVWYDGNGDGVRQSSEPGIPGVTVAITDVNGVRIAWGVTDAAGIYRIEVAVGSGYVAGPDWAASPALAGLAATTPAPAFLPPLIAGQQWMEARFGIGEAGQTATGAHSVQGALLGAIGNLVFLDADRNGRYGAGDAPLGGVTVALIRDANGDRAWDPGEPIIASAVTSSTVDATAGNYRFSGAPAGNYLVYVSDVGGVLADYTAGPTGAASVDGNSQANPYPISLAAGAVHLAADFGYYRAAGLMAGVIGNLVWGETDGDGRFTPPTGDLGVAGVTVTLLQDGDTIAATTTGAEGSYAFVGRPPGAYQVTVSDDFGVLAGYAATTLGPFPGQDNNNQMQPYTVTLPSNGVDLTADFGYRTGQDAGQNGATYAISVSGGGVDVRPGTTLTFTIRITNTGAAWITYLPLQLAYNPTYLAFVSAVPAPSDSANDGLLRWRDLTAAYSALASGAAVTVAARFSALIDTGPLPERRATVTATVQGAWANPDGPSLLGSLLLLPTQSAADWVRIFQPTGLTVTGLAAGRTPTGVAVTWRTINEANVMGFDVLRRAAIGGNAGAWRVVSPSLILARHAGAGQGDDYRFADEGVSPSAPYEYQLAVWLLDGRKVIFGPVAARP